MSAPAAFYVEFLEREGFRPGVDEWGDVIFKFEGGNYVITLTPDDEAYFRVLYPNFWRVEDDEEHDRALRAANHATRQIKAAKVHLSDEPVRVSASVELFFDEPEHLQGVFLRGLGAIQSGVRAFVDHMHDHRPPVD